MVVCRYMFSKLVRWNGTTAGLGYKKVGLEWFNNNPGPWICDRTIKLEDVDGLNDKFPKAKICWLLFRYRYTTASDVW
jgi:hypothetical protein